MGGTKGRVGALGEVKALSLPASDLPARPWGLASSSCFLVGLAGRLLQGLYSV